LGIGAAAMIPVIVTHSLFANSMFFPYLMETLWVVWGLVYTMSVSRPDDPARDPPGDDVQASPRFVRLIAAR
jgi:hypothetical protein